MNNTTFINLTIFAADIPEPSSYWLTAFFVVYILVSLFANLMVISAFCIEPRLRDPFNYFLLNLSISDLTNALFAQTHLAVYTHYNYWPLGYKHCTFWLFFDWLSVNESICMMAVISVDRLWATFWPLHYRQHFNTRRSALVILASWIIVTAGILPGQMYDRLNSVDRYGPTDCYWDFAGPVAWATPLYVVPFTEWIPVFTTLSCYGATSIRLFVLPRFRSAPSAGAPAGHQRRIIKDRQAFVMLCALVVALIIGWFPWLIYSALLTYDNLPFSQLGFLITYWFGYTTAVANPLLLLTFNRTIRRTALSFIRCSDVYWRPLVHIGTTLLLLP
ncbi:5-hydroxytryptamine receptor 2A-like, partial [Paramacrobiotus metropolitanus]|uniref:5-hydroxytryptamine receptor 2A-like n=1 Tax=Paramacrobiotus metropolitanus TaxID=2943436 RepID=UPI002445804B